MRGTGVVAELVPHRRSHVARLLAQPAVARHHGELVVQLLDAGPPGTGGGLVRRENEPGELPAVVQGTRASIIARVEALGLADPQGRTRACAGLTPGTTSGTSRFARKAPLLSTTTAPRDAATGPQRRHVVGHVEHRHVDAVEDVGADRPHGDVLAADRELPSGRA